MAARETWFNVDASPHWCNTTRTPASSALLHNRGPPMDPPRSLGETDGGWRPEATAPVLRFPVALPVPVPVPVSRLVLNSSSLLQCHRHFLSLFSLFFLDSLLRSSQREERRPFSCRPLLFRRVLCLPGVLQVVQSPSTAIRPQPRIPDL